MIKLLLVVGVAGVLSSSADAKIEMFGVDRSSDEIGTPGRALVLAVSRRIVIGSVLAYLAAG